MFDPRQSTDFDKRATSADHSNMQYWVYSEETSNVASLRHERIFVQSIPAFNRKSMLRFYRCRQDWLLIGVGLYELKNAASHTAGLENCHLAFYGSNHKLVIYSIRVDYHQEFYYFKCYQVFLSNPENPGFCPHTNPGLPFENRRVYPGFRVPRYPGCIPYERPNKADDHAGSKTLFLLHSQTYETYNLKFHVIF